MPFAGTCGGKGTEAAARAGWHSACRGRRAQAGDAHGGARAGTQGSHGSAAQSRWRWAARFVAGAARIQAPASLKLHTHGSARTHGQATAGERAGGRERTS